MFDQLPEDRQLLILSKLQPREIVKFGLVNKKIRTLTDSDQCWKVEAQYANLPFFSAKIIKTQLGNDPNQSFYLIGESITLSETYVPWYYYLSFNGRATTYNHNISKNDTINCIPPSGEVCIFLTKEDALDYVNTSEKKYAVTNKKQAPVVFEIKLKPLDLKKISFQSCELIIKEPNSHEYRHKKAFYFTIDVRNVANYKKSMVNGIEFNFGNLQSNDSTNDNNSSSDYIPSGSCIFPIFS